MSAPLTALVVGAGVGGLTAALALARAGLLVTVVEQAAALGEVGAGLQVSPNATRVLFHLGLDAGLSALAFRPEAVEARGWQRGQEISRVPLGETARERYGFPYFHMHRADLVSVLARTGPDPHGGLTFFAVEKGTPGFGVSRSLKKTGWRASDTAELVFEQCRVPVENRIGDEGAAALSEALKSNATLTTLV